MNLPLKQSSNGMRENALTHRCVFFHTRWKKIVSNILFLDAFY